MALPIAVITRCCVLERTFLMATSHRPIFIALALVLGALALYGVANMFLQGPARSLLRQLLNLFWPALGALSLLCFIRARGGPLGNGRGFRAFLFFVAATIVAFVLVNALGLAIDFATHATGERGVGEPVLYLSIFVAPGIGAVAGWLVLRRAQHRS
jgi:hypothetical protein